VKMIGLPLGVGILIDAFLIRLTVNPAIMRIFGRSAWYLPRWLDRILPTIRIDAEKPTRGEEPHRAEEARQSEETPQDEELTEDDGALAAVAQPV